ncbi:XRE family transcriptional regulator, partial [bacterium CPR1]|nr:XRE family transcriptional regulator [bacterium CPR1]
MMLPTMTGSFLRKQRKARGLTQNELGRAIGADGRRVADWENLRRLPGAEEQSRLARVLRVEWARPTECSRGRADTANLASSPMRYHPPSDRPMSVRLAAARDRWPEAVARLEQSLARRADRAQISRFLVRIACGSAEEALFDLRSLSGGARSVRASPLRAGFRLRPVVDPATGLMVGDLRVPALELALGDWQLLLIPQVSVQVLVRDRTGTGLKQRTPTVDFLVKAAVRGRILWFVLEVDGTGHDPRGDSERARHIGVPIVRLSTEEVATERCLDTLQRKLEELAGG